MTKEFLEPLLDILVPNAKRVERMPYFIPTMQPKPIREGEHFDPRDPGWYIQEKINGDRAEAVISRGRVRLISRHDKVLRHPQITDPVGIFTFDVIFDGEVAVFDSQGRSDLNLLRTYPNRAEYVIFDILYISGRDLTGETLSSRKEVLEAIFPHGLSRVSLCSYYDNWEKAIREVVGKRGEGIVAKRAESLYWPGKESRDWRKIKYGETALEELKAFLGLE